MGTFAVSPYEVIEPGCELQQARLVNPNRVGPSAVQEEFQW